MPVSAVVSGAVDFLISLVILGILMAAYQTVPDWRIVTLPLFLLLALGASFGFGLWCSALNVKYRDFRYIVPVFVQFGLLISPVGFTSDVVPPAWRLLYSLNPMAGVIDGFRWALLGGTRSLYLPGIALSAVFTALVLVSGLRYFRRSERTFADVI